MTDRPTTEAGRALLVYLERSTGRTDPHRNLDIANVEAEARAVLIDELVAAVERVDDLLGEPVRGSNETTRDYLSRLDRRTGAVEFRAAVLRLLEGARHGK